MSSPTLFPPPQVFALPLSRGGDLHVDFVYKPMVLDPAGDPVLVGGQPSYQVADYPAGAVVTLTIDTDPRIIAVAAITGPHAIVHIDYLAADQIPARVLWRCVLTTTDGLDTVIANGTTTRHDGKPA
jgi:hypothetical protein